MLDVFLSEGVSRLPKCDSHRVPFRVAQPLRRRRSLGSKLAVSATYTTSCSGFTTLGVTFVLQVEFLEQRLEQVLGGPNWDRQRLQKEGAALDERTRGRWLLTYLETHVSAGGGCVLDSVRTRLQVEPVLESVSASRLNIPASA